MSPIIPIWLLLLAFLATTGLVIFSYRAGAFGKDRFRRILSLFRFVIFLIIVLLIANIKWDRIIPVTKKPIIRIFFDNSVSSGYHQSVSRESLLNGYADLLRSLEGLSFDTPLEPAIEVFSFGESVQPLDGSPLNLNLDESATDISSVLSTATETVGDEHLNAIIIVTDGQTTVGADPLGHLLKHIPTHTIGIGEPMRMVDIRISKVKVPTVVIKGETVLAEVTIESFGEIDQRVHVSFEKEGRLLGTRIITPEGDGSNEIIRFQFQVDDIGKENYEIKVSSLKDEINIDNNRFPFSISVLKDRFKVAILTGVPSFNSRFLKLALSGEENIEINHFTQSIDGWEPSIANFWRQSYDLIILDNFPSQITPERWVKDLGQKLKRSNTALALITGNSLSKSKLDAFLPVLGMQPMLEENRTKEKIRIEALVTNSNPMAFIKVDWASFPPLKPYLFIEPGLEGMEVTAQFSDLSGLFNIPLLVVGEVFYPLGGKELSRRAVFTSAELWHLYFRGKSMEGKDEILSYWTELLKWLAATTGDDSRYFRMTKSLFQRGEEVSIEGTFPNLTKDEKNAGIWWRIKHSKIGESLIPLEFDKEGKMWRGSFIAAEPGLYRYWTLVGNEKYKSEEPHGDFQVQQAMLELKNVYLNKELLESISKSSGGQYSPWENRDEIIKNIAISPEKRFYSQAINFSHWPPFLLLLVLLLTSEWALRRIRGLQ